MCLLMGATGWWNCFNAAEDLASSLGLKLFFADLQYLAIVAIPVLWYAFGSSHLREERSRKGRHPLRPIWIVPAATAVLVWLDPWLGLVRHSFALLDTGGIPTIGKEFGPWFWVHSLYSYVFIVLGTILIIAGAGSRGRAGRAQRVPLALVAILPLCANALYLARVLPFDEVDPTPIAFALSGLLLILSLTRYRFLAGLAAVRIEIVEQLRNPVVVIDYAGWIAYANAAARAALGLDSRPEGTRLSDLGEPISSLGRMRPGDRIELSLRGASGSRVEYEARSGSIGAGGKELGTIVTLFDVTRRIAAEEALKEANSQLEGRIDERTRSLEDSNARLSMELDHRVRIERQLTYEALHDPLTGLANRSLLLSRIELAIMRRRRDPSAEFGLLYVDFDGFKAVNDSFGHAAGDAFLQEMASRLKLSMRKSDTIARVGGDEFAVLLDEPSGRAGVEEAADRLAEDLAVPAHVGGGSVSPSSSIGLLLGDESYSNAVDVLRDADIAMSGAKAAGRNRRVLFEEGMRSREDERSRLISALRADIASGLIRLAYQPIVRMRGAVAGWEVLARWRTAEFGDVGPDRFIPLAEESGLIVPLGAFVLIEALRQAASLRDEGLIKADGEGQVFFSVNVSAIQLENPEFTEFVLDSVARMGLPRSILHLELTESSLVEGRESATAVLARLAASGISIKMDDFGMGYSSLSYLHRMPIESVKIDKSFIDRISSGGGDLVRGIISLAHDLGKSVVAEGVETSEQEAALLAYGCDYGQGWLYGKPLDASSLERSLRS